MPVVDGPTPIASVLGEARAQFSRHVFLGGNAFVLRMLNRYRVELGVTALPQELELAAQRTAHHLATVTATVGIEHAVIADGELRFEVQVRNLAGHKLPTAYPSRRVWLHVTVRNAGRGVIFESGAVNPTGAIEGNDNDRDPLRFEPHHREVRRPDEVQIYEAIIEDAAGVVTTGLLRGVRFVKDNRLLPRGFDKTVAEPDVAVRGAALQDDSFEAGGDRTRYSVGVAGTAGPYEIDAVVRFQPIAYRWADNLRRYDAAEVHRFVAYYDSMSSSSSQELARSTAVVP
jgi:hypothetical protein